MSSESWNRYSSVRACALCQSRKVKCDRKNPCSGCVKAGVDCVPSQPATVRRSRPQRQDLQKRLDRCEKLLSEYASAYPPQGSEQSPEKAATELLDGLLIDDSGDHKFTNNLLWGKVQEELRLMRDIVDNDIQQDIDTISPSFGSILPGDSLGLASRSSSEGADCYQPDAAHGFFLWQIFLDRVHPLTKIIHAPSLQPILVEGAADPASRPRNEQALLLSVYLMAATSMTDQECRQRLGRPKESVLEYYSHALRSILNLINILKGYDVKVLQALVFYTMFLRNRYEHESAWILNGLVVRVAQKLGMHRDGETLGLSLFKTEMRRRIWAQIVVCDHYSALNAGLSPSPLPSGCDTKRPSSASDSDLFPEMTFPPTRAGATEMVFVLYNIALYEVYTKTPRMAKIISKSADDVEEGSKSRIEELKTVLNNFSTSSAQLLQLHGDKGAGPVHLFTFNLRDCFLSQAQTLLELSQKRESRNLKEAGMGSDLLLEASIFVAERSIDWYQAALPSRNFAWFARIYLNIDTFLYLSKQIIARPADGYTDRAWTCLEAIYNLDSELFDFSDKRHLVLAKHVLRAWASSQTAVETVASTGGVSTPLYISRLKELLPSIDWSLSRPGTTASYPGLDALDANTPPGDSWNEMFSSIDMANLDWNFLGTDF